MTYLGFEADYAFEGALKGLSLSVVYMKMVAKMLKTQMNFGQKAIYKF